MFRLMLPRCFVLWASVFIGVVFCCSRVSTAQSNQTLDISRLRQVLGEGGQPNDISMTEYCGNWQEKQLYDCGGLGDQLIGILTAFTVALITNRAFIINYPEFDSVFEPVNIDWRFKYDIALNNYDYFEIRDINAIRLVNDKTRPRNKVLHFSMMNMGFGKRHFKGFLRLSKKYKTVMVRANHGITVISLLNSYGNKLWWQKKLLKMGLQVDTMPGPKAEILESVKQIDMQLTLPSVFSVCIHVRPIRNRRSDDSILGTTEPIIEVMNSIEFIFKCARNITDYFAAPGQEVKWFFSSSLHWVKDKAFEQYPDIILKTDVDPKHVARVGMEEFRDTLKGTVKEWYLFSRCNKFVFFSSGFSKTAAAYSMIPNSAYMFPHWIFSNYSGVPEVWEFFCSPDHPMSAYHMAKDWSKL